MRAAVTPRAAVCATKPIASFVEAFNDSGAGSSLGMFSTASRIPPSVAACSRNPRGAELTLAPREMCYQDVRSLLYFHFDQPRLRGVRAKLKGGGGSGEQRGWEGSGCLCGEGPCLRLAGMARVFSAGMLTDGLSLGLFLSWQHPLLILKMSLNAKTICKPSIALTLPGCPPASFLWLQGTGVSLRAL